MTAPGGLLDFFALEAAEYLDRLDSLVTGAPGTGPDLEAVHRQARALRGSATMARATVVAELAGALERFARALRDGHGAWQPAAHQGPIVSTVDELRTLVRKVRMLDGSDAARAQGLVAELERLTPTAPATAARPVTPSRGFAFLASELDDLAAAVALLRTRPNDPAALPPLAERVRRLRGIAALREVPPVGEVIEGVERALKPLELGNARFGEATDAVLGSAFELLRQASASLKAGERPATEGPAVAAFVDALHALDRPDAAGDRIVPIAELFFQDGGPTVVSRAEHPPTSLGDRFRLEVVSLAEHLRRLVGDAKESRDAVSQDRLGRELRAGLTALQHVADSFGERVVAAFAERLAAGASQLAPANLEAIGEAARLLADPSTPATDVVRGLATLGITPTGTARTVSPTPLANAPVSATPISATPVATAAIATPTAGAALHDALSAGIAGLGALERTPLATPSDVHDETIVPIDRLVYRGRAALERALELRDAIKRRGDGGTDAELAELFDLLDLVGAE
jgi:hypothetical protein